jgi:DNA end-binding protein Ku
MPRPIWSGSISFGLVNVPVKLFSATSPKEVRFHMLHDKDGGRIQQKRVCSIDGEEVPWEHIIKGFEISKGRYVSVTRDELQAFNPRATRTIEIEDFVELSQIDPIYYQTTYYLVPDKGAAKPYALLVEAMKQTGKVGVARFVLRTKQYLCAVRPKGRALALSTMLYQDEVVEADELEGLPTTQTKPAERELKMAEQLVESLSGKFEIEKYRDEYREQVLALLEKKAEGEEILYPKAGFTKAHHAGVGGQPRRPGAARPLAPQERAARRGGLRSRPGRAGRSRPVLRSGPSSQRDVRPSRSAIRMLAAQRPQLIVSNMKKSLRPCKVLVDWSQNDPHKTTICVYSLRARERPTVSTPVTWEEVRSCSRKKDAALLSFDAQEVLRRTEEKGDLFAPLLSLKQKLPRAQ